MQVRVPVRRWSGGNIGQFGRDGFPPGGGGPLMPTGQLFMWLLIVGVTMLFAALSSAAIVRIGTDGRMFPLPSIVWANTAVLLASSITLGMVQWRVRRRRFAESVPTGLLWLTVALGGLFVAGQLSAWRELMAHGLGLARMPAVDFFYVLTAAHGLHLAGWADCAGGAGGGAEASAGLPTASGADGAVLALPDGGLDWIACPARDPIMVHQRGEETMSAHIQVAESRSPWVGGISPFGVSWQKLMMWIFILSDAFIFGSFLVSYATSRASVGTWVDTGKVFALHIGGTEVPLLLIAIMTFILVSSSGTMALAVANAYERNKRATVRYLTLTMLLGLTFVGCQAYEWTHLIVDYGVRPWWNPFGPPQFGAYFFTLTGFHGLHVLSGVIYLGIIARQVAKGVYDRRGSYANVEIAGLYWHFVDLIWVFIFTMFYLF
jgi:cytochrome c oxidase subunit 3